MSKILAATSHADLDPKHQALLRASAITPEIATETGYRSINDSQELIRLGFIVDQARLVPGLLVPSVSPEGKRRYQFRPDHPRTVKSKLVKYETARGADYGIHVPPRLRPMMQDVSVPLLVTEGTRKADSAASAGLCCIALAGVWQGLHRTEEGERVLLSDWEHIALKGRRVIIGFDSDVTEKYPVFCAMRELADALRAEGAHIEFLYLPEGESGSKVGIDDFLSAGHSADELLSYVEPSLRPVPTDVVKAVVAALNHRFDKKAHGQAVATTNSLVLKEGISDEDIEQVAMTIKWVHFSINDPLRWFLGDLHSTLKTRHGDKLQTLRKLLGDNLAPLARKYAVVCTAFPPESRQPGIRFCVHARLAPLTEERRIEVFREIKERGLSKDTEIDALLKELLGEPAKFTRPTSEQLKRLKEIIPGRLLEQVIARAERDGTRWLQVAVQIDPETGEVIRDTDEVSEDESDAQEEGKRFLQEHLNPVSADSEMPEGEAKSNLREHLPNEPRVPAPLCSHCGQELATRPEENPTECQACWLDCEREGWVDPYAEDVVEEGVEVSGVDSVIGTSSTNAPSIHNQEHLPSTSACQKPVLHHQQNTLLIRDDDPRTLCRNADIIEATACGLLPEGRFVFSPTSEVNGLAAYVRECVRQLRKAHSAKNGPDFTLWRGRLDEAADAWRRWKAEQADAPELAGVR